MTKEEVERLTEIVRESKFITVVSRKWFGNKSKNKFYTDQVRQLIDELDLDTTHFGTKWKWIKRDCKECGQEFDTKDGGRESTEFCGHSCSNRWLAKNRDQAEVNAKIQTAMDEYTAKQKALGVFHADVEKNCLFCGQLLVLPFKRRHKQFCDHVCVGKYWGPKAGHIGGKISASKGSIGRSKNEMLFAELCHGHFDNVLCNEKIFNGWDADVILQDQKFAILWNGVWHYNENVRPGHSLLQVQTRDRKKLVEIEKCGYSSYIIKDMGSHNPDFVFHEFNKFMEFIGE